MMRSMWSGVAGLKTHQLEMDVIGNNIANVNSTSYKSQATGFSDVLYQTIKPGTGAGDNIATTNAAQVGFGAKMSSILTNITKQGSAVLTDNVLDLMITGDSFFCIDPDISDAEVNFSRDGSFTIDANGDLVTQNSGYYVMGVMGDVTIGDNPTLTNIKVINRNTERISYDAQGNQVTYQVDAMPGAATTAAYFKGNIDSEDSNLENGKTLTIETYGSDGKVYTLKFNLTGDENDDETFKLTLSSVLDENSKKVAFDTATEIELEYDAHSGKLLFINGLPTESVNFTITGDASVVGPLNIDFSSTSNYAGDAWSHSSSIYGYKGDKEGQNMGYPEGELVGISFGTDGSVFGRYSNGQTVKKAQIVVAEFNNAMGLEKVGDNLYAASLNSGVPMYMDITSDGGYMSSGVLEGSNVDLAKEFTDMITTQRGFQANSKVITTSDEMLQILKSLKR